MARRNGISLVETLVAAMVLAIVVLGAISVRYSSLMEVKKGTVQAEAARAGLFILEAWRGAVDPNTFPPLDSSDPTKSLSSTNLDISPATGPTVTPDGYTQQGSGYKLVVTNPTDNTGISFNCFATLRWIDRGTSFLDTTYNKRRCLREFQVIIGFPDKGQSAAAVGDITKTISFSTYKYYSR